MFLPGTYLYPYFISVILLLGIFLFTDFRLPKTAAHKLAGIGLLGLPIVYFFYIVFSHSVNIPFTDDYELLKTFYTLLYEPELVEKTKALFEQVNQHRFAFERLVMLGIYLAEGVQNIKTQIILGNLFLPGILFLLYRLYRSEGFALAGFLPVAFLLFNLIYYENAIWGIAALQNTPLIFFAMLAAYGLSLNSRKGFYGALVCAVVITFVSGSGIAVWPIGLVLLGLQKRFRLLGTWLGVAVLVGLFYFLFDYYYYKSDSSALFRSPFENLIYALGFWGNVFYLDRPHPTPSSFYLDVLIAVLAGAVLVGVFVWLFLRILMRRSARVPWTWWFLAGSMLFFLATGAMLVLSRPIDVNIIWGGEVFARRYMIFGTVFLVCGYLSVLLLLKENPSLQRVFVLLSLGGAVALNLGSYYVSLYKVREHRENLVMDTYYLPTHRMLLTSGEKYGDKFFWNHPTKMTDLVKNLARTGIYINPVHPLISVTRRLTSVPELSSEAMKNRTKVTTSKQVAWAGVIKDRMTFSFSLPEGFRDEPRYLALRSDKNLFLMPALPLPNPFFAFLQTGNYYGNQYRYSIWRSKFVKGTYEIWLLSVDASGQWSRTPTRQLIEL